jgi:hypothetical protein
VGYLVEDEMGNERRQAYSSRDLRGLRVEHAVVSIMLVQIFWEAHFHDLNVYLAYYVN